MHSFATADDASHASEPDLSSDDDSEPEVNDGWTNHTGNVQVREFDDSNVGPRHQLPAGSSPLDFFKLFWTEHIVDVIITETNRLVIRT